MTKNNKIENETALDKAILTVRAFARKNNIKILSITKAKRTILGYYYIEIEFRKANKSSYNNSMCFRINPYYRITDILDII